MKSPGRPWLKALALALLWGGMPLFTGGCAPLGAHALGRRSAQPYQAGKASYYSAKLRGNKTASGARYRPRRFTCAHRTLPFGTKIEVRVPSTGRKAVCVVNDRGPYVDGRILDVSGHMARRLGIKKQGVARVEIYRIGR